MTFKPYPKYKASGIELLGDIPEGWVVKKLKHHFAFLDGKRVPLSGEERSTRQGVFPYYGASGVIDHIDDYIFDEDLILVSEDGANLLNRATPISFVAKGKYWVNNHAHILRPLDNLLGYWSERIEHEDITPIVTGSAQPKLTVEALANMYLTSPTSNTERREIAEFIASSTPSIDTLIAKQEAMIGLLKEKRQAVISHAVTKGLYPGVRMKASGVEWLGDVPAHWDVKKLKYVARVQGGVAKGRNLGDQETIVVPYLRVANVQDGFLDLEDVAMIEIGVSELDRYSLRSGDVLMNEGGDNDKLGRGHIWYSEIELCIHQNHVFAVRPIIVEPEWLNLVTSSGYARHFFLTKSKQSTNLASISSSSIQELPVVCPPENERHNIITYVHATTLKIDALIAKAQQAIALQKEHRTALISAAVTGKIDVRGEVTERRAA